MKRVSLALALAAILPAVLLAQKVSYDFDKSVNFTGYKTFALRDGTPVGQKLIDDRFVASIEEQFTKKGLKKSDATPDLLVAYHVAFDKEKNIQSWSTGVGGHPYGWGYGGGWGTTTTDVRVYDIVVGTLVIDVADATKKEVVWRGVGTKEVDTQAKASKLDKNVAKAVEKVLKDFPPKVKKK